MPATVKAKLAEIESHIDERVSLLNQEVDAAAAQRAASNGAVHLRRALVLRAVINAPRDEAEALRRLMY
ncbi:hypothetical protein [Hansschlegelia beijingensis]|uniref:Uncharacterized protein n=1 Tax=Hansschlegelia beijingensis TaxID=1133344 RepID=A0A7W6D751_9HYPH|nr:hypothetical protein [Hansschlegelia beijingensis]MBB3974413.1 hypothetical protein [Hansschlegelia beijingensis]